MKSELTIEIVKEYGLNAGTNVVGIAAAKDFGSTQGSFMPTDVLPDEKVTSAIYENCNKCVGDCPTGALNDLAAFGKKRLL